jgi:hypothetical protein
MLPWSCSFMVTSSCKVICALCMLRHACCRTAADADVTRRTPALTGTAHMLIARHAPSTEPTGDANHYSSAI